MMASRCSRRGRHDGFPCFGVVAAVSAAELGRYSDEEEPSRLATRRGRRSTCERSRLGFDPAGAAIPAACRSPASRSRAEVAAVASSVQPSNRVARVPLSRPISATGSFRGPNGTRLLTQRGLLTRESENIGGIFGG
jgi:hypothetical protein